MSPMTRTLTCLVAAALAGAGSTTAQSGLGLKGGFSYGNVSNRGLLPGNLTERTGFALGLSAGTGRNMLRFGVEALYAQRGVTGASLGASSAPHRPEAQHDHELGELQDPLVPDPCGVGVLTTR